LNLVSLFLDALASSNLSLYLT